VADVRHEVAADLIEAVLLGYVIDHHDRAKELTRFDERVANDQQHLLGWSMEAQLFVGRLAPKRVL